MLASVLRIFGRVWYALGGYKGQLPPAPLSACPPVVLNSYKTSDTAGFWLPESTISLLFYFRLFHYYLPRMETNFLLISGLTKAKRLTAKWGFASLTPNQGLYLLHAPSTTAVPLVCVRKRLLTYYSSLYQLCSNKPSWCTNFFRQMNFICVPFTREWLFRWHSTSWYWYCQLLSDR